MAIYKKKIQVLLTEEQFQNLMVIAKKQNKKLSVLAREAIEECHLKRAKQQQIANAVDRLLSFPEQPILENYQEWEAKYQKEKYSDQ